MADAMHCDSIYPSVFFGYSGVNRRKFTRKKDLTSKSITSPCTPRGGGGGRGEGGGVITNTI